MNGLSLETMRESEVMAMEEAREAVGDYDLCLLYTSDAADDP